MILLRKIYYIKTAILFLLLVFTFSACSSKKLAVDLSSKPITSSDLSWIKLDIHIIEDIEKEQGVVFVRLYDVNEEIIINNKVKIRINGMIEDTNQHNDMDGSWSDDYVFRDLALSSSYQIEMLLEDGSVHKVAKVNKLKNIPLNHFTIPKEAAYYEDFVMTWEDIGSLDTLNLYRNSNAPKIVKSINPIKGEFRIKKEDFIKGNNEIYGLDIEFIGVNKLLVDSAFLAQSEIIYEVNYDTHIYWNNRTKAQFQVNGDLNDSIIMIRTGVLLFGNTKYQIGMNFIGDNKELIHTEYKPLRANKSARNTLLIADSNFYLDDILKTASFTRQEIKSIHPFIKVYEKTNQ